MENLKFAIYLLVALVPALVLHEYAHALAADRLGDPSPRRWGRLTLNPLALIDPFGSVILPGLILILVASGQGLLPIFAYAKPMPLDPTYLHNPKRDSLIVVLAGLGANLVLAAVAGIALRVGVTGEAGTFVYAWLVVNVFMFVFQLMPVPGLDGAKLLARVLPPKPREVYVNLDQYLVLFMLVIFFLLAAPLLSIVRALASSVCTLLTGANVC
ncbi:MAG TPA: site-2 protease family protein [Actinomycetota bacterium]|jgi:Zn-dependent protease